MKWKKAALDRIKDLENKVRELERIVGQKQIKIDYLDKMICLAGEELGVDKKTQILHHQLVQ